MPRFDFKCRLCGHVFERQIKKPTRCRQCPKCGDVAYRLYNGSVGLVFKGSGFYVNDYKHKQEIEK